MSTLSVSFFRVSSFRHRGVVWTLLIILLSSFFPSVSMAQQPTATISALSGNVRVNGQKQGKGAILNAGDVIETQIGARVVLELSDGSLLELGESTKVDLAELAQTVTGARVSWVKLMWGRIRAKLSPGHQQAGSSFEIETPNALVGVKFSQPDIEVSYDPAKQETIALALTVALAVKNLITDEEKMIPIGSVAIITALGIKLMAGAAVATGVIGTESAAGGATTGMSTATKVAIGAGALAAAGAGTAVVVSNSGEKKEEGSALSFTGTFVSDMDHGWLSEEEVFTLTQQGTSGTGTYSINAVLPGGYCDPISSTIPLAGTVNNGEFTFSLSFSRACAPCPIPPPPGWHTSWCVQIESGNYTVGLDDNRAMVFLDQPSCTALVNPDPAVFVICPGGNPGCFQGRYPRMQ